LSQERNNAKEKNKRKRNSMDLKETARTIFMNAVKAADPYFCIKNAVFLNGGLPEK